jgi:hypothetical protein
MRTTAALLTLSLLLGAARADEPRERAKNELQAGLGLLGTSVALAVLGGGLAGGRGGGDQGDQQWRGGLGVGVVGGILFLPALELTIYGAGHRSGLATRLAVLDQAEREARHEEIAGIVSLSGGAVLAAGGACMAIFGVGSPSFGEPNQGSPGNDALFGIGMALAVIGDAAWLAGMVMWPHAAGRRKGLREARMSLTGIAF